MNDLMLDIETLSKQPGAIITQIGACFFDRYTAEIGEEFQVNIDVIDSIKNGFIVDGSTLNFWLNEPGSPSFLFNPQLVRPSLESLNFFVKNNMKKGEYLTTWAHATFDFSILPAAYHKMGVKYPFHYRAMRDLRTLVDLAGVKYSHKGRTDKHDALGDCRFQVGYACRAFNKLKNKRSNNVRC